MNQKVIYDGSKLTLRDDVLTYLRTIYPNLESELKKMEAWLFANPKRKKEDYLRFIVNWMNKTVLHKQQEIKPEPIDRYKIENDEFNKKMKQWKSEQESEIEKKP